MLGDGWNAEVGENENENENVIDAQGVFDQVSSQKFETFLGSAKLPDEQIK